MKLGSKRHTSADSESLENASDSSPDAAQEFRSERTKHKFETASVYLTDAIFGTSVLSEVDVTSAISQSAELQAGNQTAARIVQSSNDPHHRAGRVGYPLEKARKHGSVCARWLPAILGRRWKCQSPTFYDHRDREYSEGDEGKTKADKQAHQQHRVCLEHFGWVWGCPRV